MTRIVSFFLQGPLPVLLIVAALAAGAVSLAVTPREEEPQIVVPVADVLVSAPGLSAEQVERQITSRLEKLLSQIDGVEYVYSASSEGRAIVTVRFFVGEDREDSLVKIHSKLQTSVDLIPETVTAWVVKPIEVDDVPIVIATLWSRDPARYDHYHLRRLAEELELELQALPGTNRIEIAGGQPREVRVELDPAALAARRTAPLDVVFAVEVSSDQSLAGQLERADRSLVVEAGRFIRDASELEDLVVNVVDGLPVYLRDVADVIDGPRQVDSLTWLGFGPAAVTMPGAELYPSVSLAVAKKRGTNAVRVAAAVLQRLEELEGAVIPDGIEVEIIRNYGTTAREKVDELVEALAVAMLTVVVFIGMFLGWRAAAVIALAIPVCYGATLLVNLLAGYTINRVTLFALILALGLLVDDPITDVENIARHFREGRRSARDAVLAAVAEVRPALIMSTIAIMLSFAPLLFITGMMGPYMAPMALNVPLTVLMSMVVAFCITPYLSLRMLGAPDAAHGDENRLQRSRVYRSYGLLLRPLLRSRTRGRRFLWAVCALFVVSLLLPALRLVPLKMLPFDNKNELQVVLDMPEGTTLERTDAVLRALAAALTSVPEVESVATFAGLASPIDFNGMVRQHYLRRDDHMGDIRVQLVHKSRREQQSHEIVLRVRDRLAEVARERHANIKVVEVPPGPPVVSTLVAEIYGAEQTPYAVLEDGARRVAERLRREPLVVDVDTSVPARRTKLVVETDKEKAALSGVATQDVVRTVALAVAGVRAGTLALASEANPVEVRVSVERAERAQPGTIASLQIKGRPGITKLREGALVKDAPQPLVALGEIASLTSEEEDTTIYHKNLERVAYVFAEVAGRAPAEAILDVQGDQTDAAGQAAADMAAARAPRRAATYFSPGSGLPWSLPRGTRAVWTGEGEWKITIDVFRDLGIAFGAANTAIFVVLWAQTGSIVISLILMTAIPLTMIGIMPGFWLLNLIGETSIAGLPNPTFFTATAMIGMIALAGIVVRNSLVLVDFVHQALREGYELEEALVRSGAVRLRPIVLTAGTTFLGNVVIALDPVFSGLAWAIIFGIFASTAFSLIVVPVIYHLVYSDRPGHGLKQLTPGAAKEVVS